ncbi:flagellar motor switch protein FliN [Nocardioides marmoribigeumensis]|uniref:Flagellar motor switch protein FliN/FliY n=1 Tax=Nocardioides marmoribigeumensis TaxID=433649 RepID=A0ABU2BTZ0_9ACTN|nr:flagellar motor switch protein FliN [Nocardioides marmoribigeumensis]MDR7362082.1 flagellar motor switch protein FliN/FliY [Nocardioides marmoribigeumensis]
MTITPGALPASEAAQHNGAALAAAASAVASVLPSTSPLQVGAPSPGTLGSAMAYAGAALASFEGAVSGNVAVVVGQELVDALANSPLGSLDLAAAVQPALDAAAQALGARVGAARTVPLDLVVNDLGHPFTVVPLQAPGTSAALFLQDEALVSAAQAAQVAAEAAATAAPAATAPAQVGGTTPAPRGLELLHGVIMDVTVELGRTRMSVRDLLALTPGTVLELDRAAGSPADLLVNGRLIARGEVVVVDEDFGLRVTEIVDESAAG